MRIARVCAAALLSASAWGQINVFDVGTVTVSPVPGASNMVSIRLDGAITGGCLSDPIVQQTAVSGNQIQISLNTVITSGGCTAARIPFSKTVVVGPLAPGVYAASATLLQNGIPNMFFRFDPVVFSVAADVPAASLLTLLGLGGGLLFLRYRLVRAG